MNHENLEVLVVDHLTVNYDKTPVLWDISLKIPSGKLVGIIGPNGAGKSTFIKAVLNLIKPLSGQVLFFGQPLKQVRQRIAYVPQRESVDWDFPITVLDLVLMGRYGKIGLFRWPSKDDRHKAEKYLDLVGMASYASRQISQLSGGQQQRVFIARALLQEADIFFMDEPFSGVDLGTETALISLLKELKDQGKTIFVVHHDLATVEEYFDWVILLNMRLVNVGPVKETFTSENINTAFGKSYALFNDTLKLSQQKIKGMSDS